MTHRRTESREAAGLGEEDLGSSDLDDGDGYRESLVMANRPEEEAHDGREVGGFRGDRDGLRGLQFSNYGGAVSKNSGGISDLIL